MTGLNIQTASALGLRVDELTDINALIGATYGLDGLLLSETDLGPEFFRLGSGLAGKLFQKFVNQRLMVALILPDFSAHGARFAELAFEHARHPSVRFMTSEEAAWEWLLEAAGR